MKESILFIIDCKSSPVSCAPLKKLGAMIYKNEKLVPDRATTVVFCSDKVIRRLNRIYREIDRPTDVLSFAFDDHDFLGEIYISLPRARVQARRYGNSFSEELARLFVHGLLHLSGYDHDKAKQRLEMEAREQKYLKR